MSDQDRVRELERVLRQVLGVIDSMQDPEGCEDYMNTTDQEVNPQHCFGYADEWGVNIIEWPDLAWAKDQIVKVLGS
jgi:hypothetical protein